MATLPFSTYTCWHNSGTNSPSGNDVRHRFDLSLVSQSGLTSTIRVIAYYQVANILTNAYVQANYYKNGSLQTPTREITVEGTQSSGWYQTGTWTFTVTHNVDGTANFTFRGRGRVGPISGGWTDYRYTSVESVTLPTIPRYATITNFEAISYSMTTINVAWNANVAIDRVEYKLNNGSWQVGNSGISSTWGGFKLTGLNPGTTYNIKIRIRRKDSGLWTESSAKNVTTIDIAKITSVADNIIMGNDITVNYSNPSGSPLSISIYKTDGMTAIAPYRACSGTSYTFTLTEEEKNNMYNSIPTTNDTRFRIYIRTEADKNYLYYVERKFILTNANPIFNNFEYEDINETTLALTGDNQSIIKGFSNLKAIITTANKAVAQKGATMSKYRLVVGEKQIDVDYNASETVELTLNAIDNNVFMVYAIDSRGNSTVVQKSPTNYFAYSKVIIANGTAERTGGIGDETTLTFNGSFLNIDFGSEQNNITIAYKYKKTSDEEYIDGTTTITPIINENNFSFENIIAGDKGALGFDSKYSYDIKIIATDELSSTSYDLILGTGKPNLAIHRDGVAFGAPYDEELEGFQIVDKKITFNGLELFKWVE